MTEKVGPHNERIARYRRAYEAANGHPLDATITYEGGWYRFRNSWRQTGCYRAAKIDEMIVRLEWQVSADGLSFFEYAARKRQSAVRQDAPAPSSPAQGEGER